MSQHDSLPWIYTVLRQSQLVLGALQAAMANNPNVNPNTTAHVNRAEGDLQVILNDLQSLNNASYNVNFDTLVEALRAEDMPITEQEFIQSQQFGSKK